MSLMSKWWQGVKKWFNTPVPQGVQDWQSGKGGLLGTDNISKLWNDYTGNTQIDKQLSAQSQENQATREHNFMLAQYQNQANLAQWARENAYNSPSAQKARLQSAGLNTDMMYGGSGVQNTSASSPMMTSGAPSSPMDWSSLANKVSPMQSVAQALNNKLLQAQIDNINADTKKKGSEADILASDASFRDAYNQGILDTQHSRIRLEGSQASLNDQQISESQARITSINAQVEQLQASVEQIRNAIKNDNARLDLEKALNNAQVQQAMASAGLSQAQAKRLADEFEYLVQHYQDQHFLSLANEAKLWTENGNLILEASMKYGGFDDSLTRWEKFLKFFNQLSTYGLPGN